MTYILLPKAPQCDHARYENTGHSPVSMFSCDSARRMKWMKNPPSEMDGDDFLAWIEDAAIEGVSSRRVSDAMAWVAQTGESFYGFCVAEIAGDIRRFEVSLYPHTNNHIIGVATDLGVNDPQERAVRSLSLELAHRTKNLMAVISSLATQTSRRFKSVDDFKRRFLAQISSLSLVHDAIAQTGWIGARLEAIIKAQIEYGRTPMRATFSGDALDVMLSPNAAQNISMVVHDLIGACTPGALFEIDASFVDDTRLRLALKTDPPTDETVLWRDLLEKVAPLALGGTGAVHLDDAALRYELVLSRDHFTQP